MAGTASAWSPPTPERTLHLHGSRAITGRSPAAQGASRPAQKSLSVPPSRPHPATTTKEKDVASEDHLPHAYAAQREDRWDRQSHDGGDALPEAVFRSDPRRGPVLHRAPRLVERERDESGQIGRAHV